MAKIIKMAAVSILAMMLVLLLTATAPSTARYHGAQLRAFCSRYFVLTAGVLTQTAFGFTLMRSAASAPTLVARRMHTVSAVACFLNLACKLYLALRRPADVE